jgi:hypothetical protein
MEYKLVSIVPVQGGKQSGKLANGTILQQDQIASSNITRYFDTLDKEMSSQKECH